VSGRNTFETIGLHSQTIPDTRAQSCGSLESFGHVQNYRGPFEGDPCRRAVEVWSRCIHVAFEAFEEHSRRTLNILTAFEPIRVVMGGAWVETDADARITAFLQLIRAAIETFVRHSKYARNTL